MNPDPEHPGKVGWGTCIGCRYSTDMHFHNKVCTHPKAHEVAAKWLGAKIKAYKEQKQKKGNAQPSLF